MAESVIKLVKNWLEQNSANKYIVEKESAGRYLFVPVKDGVKLTDRGMLLSALETHEILTKMTSQHAGQIEPRAIKNTHMLVLVNDDAVDIITIVRGITNAFGGLSQPLARAINETEMFSFATLAAGGKEWIHFLYQRLQEYGVPVHIELVD